MPWSDSNLLICYVLVVYGRCHTLKEHLFIPYVVVVYELPIHWQYICWFPMEGQTCVFTCGVWPTPYTNSIYLFISYVLLMYGQPIHWEYICCFLCTFGVWPVSCSDSTSVYFLCTLDVWQPIHWEYICCFLCTCGVWPVSYTERTSVHSLRTCVLGLFMKDCFWEII